MGTKTWVGAGTLVIGSVALIATWPACGCEPMMTAVADHLGLRGAKYPNSLEIPAEVIEKAASDRYRGSSLSSVDLPGRTSACAPAGPTEVECLYWDKATLLSKEGHQFRLVAGNSGMIERVEVRKVKKWR